LFNTLLRVRRGENRLVSSVVLRRREEEEEEG